MGIYEDRPLIEQDKIDNPQDYLWGVHKEEIIQLCNEYTRKNGFPGNNKYPSNHPIWDCNIAGIKSPKEAWNDYNLLSKAVDNLYYITQKSINENKYEDFVERIFNAFCLAQPFDFDYSNYEVKTDYLPLCREVLLRFTVAKIAPKVTALQPSMFMRIIEESNIDISNGIYCPMAGFGGIIEGAKKYYKKYKINAEIEAYDINKNFCNYFGWKQRDVLKQKIITNKIVVACPPFGDKAERWKGTPDNMYYDFHQWCKLIKDYIKSPNYILIGPEIRNQSKYKSGIKPSGLFVKKYGIQWYKEYSL